MLAQLSSMRDVVLQQTTPTRVEQRRAMLVMPLAVLQASLHPHLMPGEVWDQGGLQSSHPNLKPFGLRCIS